MKTLFSRPLLLAAVVLCACGKDGSSPKKRIPANSAALKIDGVAYPIDPARSKVTINLRTNEILVELFNSVEGRIGAGMQLAEFKRRVEKFDNLDGRSPSGLWFQASGNATSSGVVYSTSVCHYTRNEPETKKFEVVDYNEAAHTLSIRFSGSLCDGNGNFPYKQATEGQFNLTYTDI